MQLNELRKELKFNNELTNLIETLKNIAAAQYHVMEKEKERFDVFMDAFAEFFRVIDLVEVQDPLVKVMSDKLGIVIVTSDSGFMGGLNRGVIGAAMDTQGTLRDEQVSLVVIGDKGATTVADQGRDFKFFPGIGQETIYEQAVEIKDYIVKEVLEGRMGKVALVHPRPISFTAQTVDVVHILPCGALFDQSAASEVATRTEGRGFLPTARRVIVESSYSDIVEYLAGVWVTSKLYEIFEDSKLAEYSARAMHLEGSFHKLEKGNKKLKHMFNKAAHELIDKGMRESFAARGKSRRRRKPVPAA